MTQPLQQDTLLAILAQLNLEVTQLETSLLSGLSSSTGSPIFDSTGLVPSNQHVAANLGVTGNPNFAYATAWTDIPATRTSVFNLLTAPGGVATPFLILGEIDFQLATFSTTTVAAFQPSIDVRLVLEDSAHTVVQGTNLQSCVDYGDAFLVGHSPTPGGPQVNYTYYMFPTITALQDAGAGTTFLQGQNFASGSFTAVFQYVFEAAITSGTIQVNECNIDIFRLQ